MTRTTIALSIAAAIAVTVGAQVARGQRDVFHDHSDTGRLVHVLPSPELVPRDPAHLDAPRERGLHVYNASYGRGNLRNHGGHEISFAGYYAIFWNSTVANSAGSQGYSTLQSQIAAFAQTYSDGAAYSQSDTAADYTIITQYHGADTIQPTLAYVGSTVDTQATRSTISDTSIQTYLASFFAAHPGVTPNASTLFGIYFPHGMQVTLQGSASCSSFCGYHSSFTYNGIDVKYAVFPYTDCTGCTLAGKAVADILTIVSSHEIREAVTDADGTAWWDSVGYEADDKCAWHNLYQMSRNGKSTFWVQPEYSNGGNGFPGPGCVVPLP
jgi:hypothetical protein